MIFHLAEQSTWDAGPPYKPDSLETEGFIHCSTAKQLLSVANNRYPGREDLVLVTIDPDQLSAPLVYEDSYDSGQRFPHIYGTIDADAVVSVEQFRPSPGGSFAWSDPDLRE